MEIRTAAFLAIGLFSNSLLAEEIPGRPFQALQQRLEALEQEVERLRNSDTQRLLLVDASGKTIAPVIATTLDTALLDIEIAGRSWKLPISADGPSTEMWFRTPFYLTTDCSGPAYYFAGNWATDDEPDRGRYTIWGGGYLPYNQNVGEFQVPSSGAMPLVAETGSIDLVTRGCVLYPGVRELYLADDLESVDPVQGYDAPFRIVPAP